MDRLEQRLARFLAPAATARCIPEARQAVHHLGAAPDPLLHPPRQATGTTPGARPRRSSATRTGGLDRRARRAAARRNRCSSWPAPSSRHGRLRGDPPAERPARDRHRPVDLVAEQHRVRGDARATTARSSAGSRDRGYDVSRRSYDLIDPAGRALFLVDADGDGAATARPGRWSATSRRARRAARGSSGASTSLRIVNTRDGLRTTVEITLPGADDPVGALDDHGREPVGRARERIKVVPYLEWVLNRPDADRGHTQYNRLFAEMEYVARAARRPGLGQACEGDGRPRRGRRARRVPDLADRLHRPRPEPLDAAGAGDAGVLRGPRHRRAPDLRPDRQPAPGPDRARRAGRPRSAS